MSEDIKKMINDFKRKREPKSNKEMGLKKYEESPRVKEDRKERKEYKEKKENKDTKKKVKRMGSRAEVWHGNAYMTTGGLKKEDLMKNKRGVLVSKRKSKMAKQNDIIKRL
jgi:hypothetical protein